MNPYFVAVDIKPFSKAREDTLDAMFSAIEAGFELLPDPGALGSITGFLAAGGAANALTVTHPFAGFEYTAGAELSVLINATSTGAATINITPAGGAPLGPRSILQPDRSALAAGQLRPGAIVKMAYDGTAFRVTGGLWAEPVLASALAALANALLTANVLPLQTGQNGRVLTTNGVSPAWTAFYALPDPAVHDGEMLLAAGGAWAAVPRYPELEAGKFLTNDGESVGWGEAVDVQTFTASGTWTKPAGARVVQIELYGAGGGGASGQKLASSVPNPGGGGGGGSCTRLIVAASELPATVAVTIGAGGAGGAPRTEVLAGAPGADGGDSVFGAVARAFGGKGATSPAPLSPSLGGNGADSMGSLNRAGFTGGSGQSGGDPHGTSGGGGAGAPSAPSAGGKAGSSELGGGGGGGGATAPGGGDAGPSAGGGPIGRIGGAPGTEASRNGGTGAFRCGGGGGVSALAAVAGSGGVGGPAGGGGGGGASRHEDAAYASGAGGNGGAGFCRVMTW